MEFIITGLSGYYSVYSFFELQKNRKDLENGKWKLNKNSIDIKELDNVKGVSINIYETKMNYPVYVNVGYNSSVGIPIGGNTYKKSKEIYNKFYNNKLILANHEYLDKYQKEYYINTYETLRNFLDNHNINDSQIMIEIPIKVKETNLKKIYYTKFNTSLFNKNHYIISPNINDLIQISTFRKRMPLSICSGIICSLGLIYIYNNKDKDKYNYKY